MSAILAILLDYKEVVAGLLALVLGVRYIDRKARKDERAKRDAADKADALSRAKRLAERKRVRPDDIKYRD